MLRKISLSLLALLCLIGGVLAFLNRPFHKEWYAKEGSLTRIEFDSRRWELLPREDWGFQATEFGNDGMLTKTRRYGFIAIVEEGGWGGYKSD
ncbi:MAG: hypothetical protein QM758_01470 [Armatimonas sp.]